MHEGGYAESVVPFSGVAIVETLVDEKSDVVDPMRGMLGAWQPKARQRALRREFIGEMAAALNGPVALRPR